MTVGEGAKPVKAVTWMRFLVDFSGAFYENQMYLPTMLNGQPYY